MNDLIRAVDAERLGQALALKRKFAPPAIALRYARAAAELIGGAAWEYDPDLDDILIQSASQPGLMRHASFLLCDCPAGRVGRFCWHQAACELIYAAHFQVQHARH